MGVHAELGDLVSTPTAESRGKAPIAVIGAGPAGLMAAERLLERGHEVTIYERMPSPARKFLMAGRGGLNLTHSEPLEVFLQRYRPRHTIIDEAVRAFPPKALLAWAHGLGIETFVGSSGRVFPKDLKASPLLRAWIRRLKRFGAVWCMGHRWTGWDSGGRLTFMTPKGEIVTKHCSAALLALGGASWPRLGSDGSWFEILAAKGIPLTPLAPSNAGLMIGWSEIFRNRFAGAPLKRISLSFNGVLYRGEAVITKSGLEGGAVYALSGDIRDALAAGESACLSLDLRPDVDVQDLMGRLSRASSKQSMSNVLRKCATLSPAAIGLLREAGPLPREPAALAQIIKNVPLSVSGISGLARAISSAGGIRLDAVDGGFMLRSLPGVFVAGEVLDWEAPTGGYLLQACFASGVAAATGIDRWLSEHGAKP